MRYLNQSDTLTIGCLGENIGEIQIKISIFLQGNTIENITYNIAFFLYFDIFNQ